ncbi:MAG: hypothetical protein ABFS56_22055 [Pseudomonadota bacterium]
MYKKSSFLRSLTVIASVTTLVGCITNPTTPDTKGATLTDAREKQVAVLESVAISSFNGKDGKRFRSELQAMLNPLFSVVTSPEKAEGVFSGTVHQSSVERSSSCKCFLSSARCVEKTATFEALIELTKAGEVIYTQTPVGVEREKSCTGQSSSDSELLRKARAKAVDEIRKDVAAYYDGGDNGGNNGGALDTATDLWDRAQGAREGLGDLLGR